MKLLDHQTNKEVEIPEDKLPQALSGNRYGVPEGLHIHAMAPSGEIGTILSSNLFNAVDNGYKILTPEQYHEHELEEKYSGGFANTALSAGIGVAESATFGTVPWLLQKGAEAVGANNIAEGLQEIPKRNVPDNIGGQLVGTVVGLGKLKVLAAPTLLLKGEKGISSAVSTMLGGSRMSKVAGHIVGGAATGIPLGIQQSLHEDMLGDNTALNAEHIMSNIGEMATIGAATAGVFSTIGNTADAILDSKYVSKKTEKILERATLQAVEARTGDIKKFIGSDEVTGDFLKYTQDIINSPDALAGKLAINKQEIYDANNLIHQAAGSKIGEIYDLVREELSKQPNYIQQVFTIKPKDIAEDLYEIYKSHTSDFVDRTKPATNFLLNQIEAIADDAKRYPGGYDFKKLEEIKSKLQREVKNWGKTDGGFDTQRVYMDMSKVFRQKSSNLLDEIEQEIGKSNDSALDGIAKEFKEAKKAYKNSSIMKDIEAVSEVRDLTKPGITFADIIFGSAAATALSPGSIPGAILGGGIAVVVKHLAQQYGRPLEVRILSKLANRIRKSEADINSAAEGIVYSGPPIGKQPVKPSSVNVDARYFTGKVDRKVGTPTEYIRPEDHVSVADKLYDKALTTKTFKQGSAEDTLPIPKMKPKLMPDKEWKIYIDNKEKEAAIEQARYSHEFPHIREDTLPAHGLRFEPSYFRDENPLLKSSGANKREIFKKEEKPFTYMDSNNKNPLLKGYANAGILGGLAVGSGGLVAGQAIGWDKIQDKMNELVSNPQVLVDRISNAIGGLSIAAPKTASALHQVITNAVKFLDKKMPRDPLASASLMGRKGWTPSDFELSRWNRYVSTINDPIGFLNQAAEGNVTKEGIETLKAVYPEIYKQLQSKVVEKLTEPGNDLSYDRKMIIGKLFGLKTTPSMQPNIASYFQQVHNESAAKAKMNSGASGSSKTAQSFKTQAQRLSI